MKFYTVGILFYVYGRLCRAYGGRRTYDHSTVCRCSDGGIWLTVRLIKNRKKKRAEVPVVQGPQESTDVTAGEE